MSSIKGEMAKGVMWTAVSRYSSLVVQILVSMVLARLLEPSEFGFITMASVFLAFFNMLASMGIGPAIIQRTDFTREDHDNVFSFSIVMGCVLSVIFFCLSWSIGRFYNDDNVIPVCQVMSLCILIATANMVPSALMVGHRRFKESALISFAGAFVTGVVSMIAAWKGFGVYSLLITPIVGGLITLVCNLHYYPLSFKVKFSLAPLKSIFSYSVYQFLFEFINYFSKNLDKFLIGKFMSPVQLGYYDKSYRLMQLPLQNLTSVVNPVIQPVLVSIKEDKKGIAAKYIKIVELLAIIGFPACIIFWFCGEEIILAMFGEKWLPAVMSFKILSICVPFNLISSPSGGFFQVSDATKQFFWVSFFNSVLAILVMLFTALTFGTIEALSVGYVSTSFICMCASVIILLHNVLHNGIKGLLKTLIFPISMMLIVGCCLWILDAMVDCGTILNLILKGSIGTILSLALIQIWGPYNILSGLKNLWGRVTGAFRKLK